jgi:hypothetical protein
VSKTLAQFNSELSLVANGTKTGTISVVDNGLVTEFRITTATNTASAKLVAGSVVLVDSTHITVKFDKPVYLAAASVPSDFTITGATSGTGLYLSAMPNVVASASNTVTLTLSAAATFVGTTTVTLHAAGAAKFLDVNGTAVTAGSTTN